MKKILKNKHVIMSVSLMITMLLLFMLWIKRCLCGVLFAVRLRSLNLTEEFGWIKMKISYVKKEHVVGKMV